MKSAALALLAGFLGAASLPAGELPILLEKPFLGNFVGFADSREFEFGIGGDGTSELYFKKGKDRLTTNGCTLHIYFIVEEKVKGRWTTRKMSEKGFETSHQETDAPAPGKPISFTATYTGDTVVEITHVFSKDGVEITTKPAKKKTKNEVRVGVRITVGDMYRHIKEEELKSRELKSKVKGTEVVVWPVGSSKRAGEKIDFDDLEMNLEKAFPKGATRVSLESARIADHEYTLTTANEKYGTFEFRQDKALLHGFYIHWWPDPAKISEKDCRLVISVK